MSDEFEFPGRTFGEGPNTRLTCFNKNYYTNEAQHLYSCDNSYTKNDGELVILTRAANTNIIGFDKVTKKAFVIQSNYFPP